MKLKNIFKAFAALLAIGSMTSCQNSFDDPDLVTPVATMEANTTLAEFKDAFKDSPDQVCPYKDEENKVPYIIKGRVVSSDATGNIYKALYIQDETAGMLFSINRNALYEYFHIGQEVVVNATGLWVGKYNNMIQIGWLTENATSGAIEMGRMAFSVFMDHTELNGNPENEVTYVTPGQARPSEGVYCIIENIDDVPKLPSSPDFYDMQGQLVEFRNVSFDEGGNMTFSRYQSNGENALVSQEGNSSKLTVRTSGYCNFYNEVLPTGTGTLRGILSYYSSTPTSTNNDGSLTGWQLLLRSMDDVIFDDKGSKEHPLTVAEAIESQESGKMAWVSGYIVGSVKDGRTVTSNDDIIFGVDGVLDNNIVIAPSPDVKDWTQCIAVQLPQGSDLRKYANLADNPTLLGQEIEVSGKLGTYLGIAGIEAKGSSEDFVIPGVTPSEPDQPKEGDGTKENPYNVDQLNASTGTVGDVWVEGYVVGYVADKNWSTAVFGNTPSETDNWTKGTNIIISSLPAGEASEANSAPVQLPAGMRAALGISQNPDIFGKKVKLKGSMESYFGRRGLKSLTEYEIEGGGSSGGDTPVTPPATTTTTIYEGLVSNASGWTFDNVIVPSAATKGIWQWDSSYGDLKGSAYIGGAYESLSYAISPEIDLVGVTSGIVSFDHAAKFQSNLTEICGLCVREAGTTAWTELTIPVWPTSGSWTYVNSGNVSLEAYSGKKIQLAFKYASTSSGADTWQIKNFKVIGNK